MKKNNLLCSIIVASFAMVLSSCHSASSTTQNLEVQGHVIAQHGFMAKSLLVTNDDEVHFRDIAYGNGIYMIVGGKGAIYTSPDAKQWTEQNGVTGVNLNGIVYNKYHNAFYAVGDNGKMFKSADGVYWEDYKELNQAINLYTISVLPDGNEVIGGSDGSIFEINLASKKQLVRYYQMGLKSGYDSSKVTSIANSSTYMVAGSLAGSLDIKHNDKFHDDDWVYSASSNNSGISDLAHYEKTDMFMSLSKDGYLSTSNAAVYESPWSSLSYIGYPDAASYKAGITSNSLAFDDQDGYIFVAGGGKDNKDTFIRYTKNQAKWNVDDVLSPQVGSLNKVRCFNGFPEPMCIAVGDKKAIVIIKIENGKPVPEPIDILKPKITAVMPQDGEENVYTNPLMGLTFNKPVGNVNNSTVHLYKDGGEDPIKLDGFKASDNDDDYTFEPAHVLEKYTKYHLVVDSAIKDKKNQSIEGKVFTFMTGNLSYPTVQVTDPKNNAISAPVLPNIKATFSEDVENVNSKNVTLFESDSKQIVEINQPAKIDSQNFIITPVNKLESLRKYCISFDRGITNLSKVALKHKYTSCFTTGSFEAPVVTLDKPSDGEIDVPQMARPLFSFSTEVVGVDANSVTLHEASEDGATVKLASIDYNSKTNKYEALPESALKLNTQYYISFGSGIKDAKDEANSLIPKVFRFKTTANPVVAVIAGDKCIYNYKLPNVLGCFKPSKYPTAVIYVKSYKKYFSVGSGGTAYSSIDGVNWNSMSVVTTNNLNAIAILNHDLPYIVTVGDKGTIVSSNDMGQNWSIRTSPTGSKNLTNIYSDGARFIIDVDGSEWLVSEDGGATWAKDTAIGKLPATGTHLILSASNGQYIAGGDKGAVYTSIDNMATWTQKRSLLNGTNALNKHVYVSDLDLNLFAGNANMLFVGNSDALTNDSFTRITDVSTNAKENYTSISVTPYGYVYMVSTLGGLYFTADGYHWTNIAKAAANEYLAGVATVDD